MMCDFIARTKWSNIKSNYFLHTMIIFDLSYYTNIMITVTFINQAMLCCAFSFFSPENYPHKSGAIFHIDLYVFSTDMEIPNGTNKLNHVKRSAVFQNNLSESHTAEWIIFAVTGISVCSPLFETPFTTIVFDGFLSSMKGSSSRNRLPFPSFVWTWCDKQWCQAQLRCSNRGRWFFEWGLFHRRAHRYQNQWNTALMEAAIMSKMRTPAITLWFPEQCLLGFFILEKQLAIQDMFLVGSKLSITVYLFLVLYRSTSLQSHSFLKNIEYFLCK